MSYEPTNWKTGDVVTSTKLNNMEQGIAGAGQMTVVGIDPETVTMQSTWQEIYDALKAGVFVYVNDYSEEGETSFTARNYIIAQAGRAGDTYYVDEFIWSELIRFETDTPTGYPAFSD